MIIKYHEFSETTEIHSDAHNVCDHELEDGWQCMCSDCQCETVIKVNAAYAYNEKRDHEVWVRVGRETFTLPANVARALASALCFAANDAETLNKEFPND